MYTAVKTTISLPATAALLVHKDRFHKHQTPSVQEVATSITFCDVLSIGRNTTAIPNVNVKIPAPKYEQYGFRTRSSTEQATFSLINNVLTAMNNNLKIGGIFCDLQKAFDCMDHKIL